MTSLVRSLTLAAFVALVGCQPDIPGQPLAGDDTASRADAASEADRNDVPSAAAFVVLHYNIGNGAARAGQDDVIAWLERGERPAIISLNEVCGARFQEVSTAAATFGYQSQFFATNPSGCGGSNAGLGYGNALLVLSSETTDILSLPYITQASGAEERNLGCVRFAPRDLPELTACVTHLHNQEATAQAQAREGLNIAAALTMGAPAPIIVAGDFNLEPDEGMSGWLEWSSSETSRPTHENGRTIDYIMTTATVARSWLEVGVSDHYGLWAEIELD